MNYFIPKDTSELLEKNNLEVKNIDNYYLRFHRFSKINFNPNKDKYEFNIKDIKNSTNVDKDKIDKYYINIKSIYPINESILATNNWRLAIGIGSASVYETSITLHHIYGIPYIPAQSIKGILRSFIIEKYFDNEEGKAFEDSSFREIFGSNDQQGKVIFFDAFTKEPKFQVDIMNNHYQKYYNGNEVPTDTQNPNPINFLTLKGSQFEIIITTSESIELNSEYFKGNILKIVKSELSESLEIFGIGSKTSVGYGYFDIQKSQEEKDLEIISNSTDINYIKNFIQKHPKHKFIESINNRLNFLKEEKEHEELVKKEQEALNKWESIQKVDKKYKKSALESFIEKYSYSKLIEDAQKELNQITSNNTKQENTDIDFSKSKDAKDIERIIKKAKEPTEDNLKDLENAIKRIYPAVMNNKKKKNQFFRNSKLITKWLGKDKFDEIIFSLE